MFEQTNAQMEQVLNPMFKAQGTMLDHFARIADFQVEALKQYSELSIENLRAMQGIHDPQSLQDYVTKQMDVAKSLGEKVSADVNEFVNLNRGFAEELQKSTQESVTTAEPQPAKKPTRRQESKKGAASGSTTETSS
ncbi:phasin family protein [Aquisalimonas sp.]|uniref:phasin family protein n=1 Tax=Aquisalimonas sp. TaxID=1872621 RepID=UPI0025B86016|nr:phasin family protein [Aquisalimonas sp.]